MRRTVLVGALVAAASVALGAPAHAATGVQRQITQQLARHPGGVQTAPNEISYRDGNVKLVIPTAQLPATCPGDWYCFFQYKDFSGRMLQFHDCGGTQFLTDYGFGNRTSSWQNRSNNTVEIYDQEVEPWKLLWTEGPDSESRDVGTDADNKADFFNTACP